MVAGQCHWQCQPFAHMFECHLCHCWASTAPATCRIWDVAITTCNGCTATLLTVYRCTPMLLAITSSLLPEQLDNNNAKMMKNIFNICMSMTAQKPGLLIDCMQMMPFVHQKKILQNVQTHHLYVYCNWSLGKQKDHACRDWATTPWGLTIGWPPGHLVQPHCPGGTQAPLHTNVHPNCLPFCPFNTKTRTLTACLCVRSARSTHKRAP